MSCVVICIALGVDVLRGGPCPPLYIRGDRVTWKDLAEYNWSLSTTQSGSFLCTAASSMPIRVISGHRVISFDLVKTSCACSRHVDQ